MVRKPTETSNLRFVVLGYDPGGVGKNGAAIITVDRGIVMSAKIETKNSVGDTVNWFTKNIGEAVEVRAAGIDTLLSWSIEESGWRPMDCYLREKYQPVKNSVIASNGLYGAMVVQGMLMAIKMRDQWNRIVLNETHPKVQYYAQTKKVYKYRDGGEMVDWLRNQMACTNFPEISNEHQWDALYSAWITLQANENKSTKDLLDINNSGVSLIFPVANVHYYWL